MNLIVCIMPENGRKYGHKQDRLDLENLGNILDWWRVATSHGAVKYRPQSCIKNVIH